VEHQLFTAADRGGFFTPENLDASRDEHGLLHQFSHRFARFEACLSG